MAAPTPSLSLFQLCQKQGIYSLSLTIQFAGIRCISSAPFKTGYIFPVFNNSESRSAVPARDFSDCKAKSHARWHRHSFVAINFIIVETQCRKDYMQRSQNTVKSYTSLISISTVSTLTSTEFRSSPKRFRSEHLSFENVHKRYTEIRDWAWSACGKYNQKNLNGIIHILVIDPDFVSGDRIKQIKALEGLPLLLVLLGMERTGLDSTPWCPWSLFQVAPPRQTCVIFRQTCRRLTSRH